MSAFNQELVNKTIIPNKNELLDKPNLVIVFPDEFRAQALGFMNQDLSITPNIDKFASQSSVFCQAISNYPLCTPFRGMLMTGQYPHKSGIQGNSHTGTKRQVGGSDFGIELKKSAVTWSDILKAQGYSMGYIGKWHLDAPKKPFVTSYNNPINDRYWNDWTPPEKRHGFDFWYAYGTYDQHLKPMYWTNDTLRDEPLHISQWSSEHETDIAIKYLRNENEKYRNSGNPFALVIAMNPPHTPYNQIPQKYLERFSYTTSEKLNIRSNVQWNKYYSDGLGPHYFKEYMAMINGIDDQFGRIINEIDQQGLSENTLVVFFSDHGCCMGSHGQATKNVHYEEAVRIPMIFRWPNIIKHQYNDLLFSVPDIYPTILGVMGMGDLIPNVVEGTNYSNTLKCIEGDISPSSQFYMSIPYGGQSYGKRGIRTKKHSLMIERKIGKPLIFMLHDNINDPYQLHNIADDNLLLIDDLIHNELIPWLEYTGDPWRPTFVSLSCLNSYI